MRQLREQNQLTQFQLRLLIGVSERRVSDWENGNAKPNLENAVALARAYKVSLKVNGELGVRVTKDLVDDLEHFFGNGCVLLGGEGQRRMKRLAQQQLFKEQAPEPAPIAQPEMEMELVEAE